MSNIFPASLLSLADQLIPPLDNAPPTSFLLITDPNSYVHRLKSLLFSRYTDILSDQVFDLYFFQSYDELKFILIESGYDSLYVGKFLSDLSEILLVTCTSCPQILDILKLLPSHSNYSNVD